MMQTEKVKMMARVATYLVVLGLLIAGCSAETDDGGDGVGERPNILLIIADDFGLDASPCHTFAGVHAPAPNIIKLCSQGVVFDAAWSAPTCSPTRASILTGRHGFRTGVGAQLVGPKAVGIKLGEHTIPKALDAALPGVYDHACIGKWHLSSSANGGADNPNKMGFGYYAGQLSGSLSDYSKWQRTENGTTTESNKWAPSVNVDDALTWLNASDRSGKPWFMWLAFNAPHAPFHVPPASLHAYTNLTDQLPKRPTSHYRAMIQALDTEIGRLLQGIGEQALAKTHIIFVGDNGTPRSVCVDPVKPSMAKGSLYQGGVAVPMVIAGPAVSKPGRSTALVHVLDLFGTILELAVGDWRKTVPTGTSVDAFSLVPYLADPSAPSKREVLMTELFDSPTGRDGKAIRNSDYKLIRYDDGDVELYKIRTDRWETKELWANDLARTDEVKEQKPQLNKALNALLSSK